MINIPEIVKDAIKAGCYQKNFRFSVKDDVGGEWFEIGNDNLIAESVSFDEKFCSAENLKFGLCQGTSLQFKYFDFPSIRGCRIESILDIQYRDTDGILKWYALPMGWFDCESCPVEAKTGIYKATCYNKLLSDYFDTDAKQTIVDDYWKILATYEDGSTDVSIGSILSYLESGYKIEPKYTETDYRVSVSPSPVIGKSDTASFEAFIGTSIGKFYPYYADVFIDVPFESYYRVTFNAKKLKELLDENIKKKDPDSPLVNNVRVTYKNTDYYNLNIQDFWGGAFKPIYQHYNFGFLASTGSYIGYEAILLGEHDEYITIDMNHKEAGSHMDFYFAIVQNTTYTDEQARDRAWDICTYMREHIYEFIKLEHIEYSPMELKRFTHNDVQSWSDATIRDLQSASFELSCLFGKLDRETDLFAGVALNNARLLPANQLYPADDLFPYGGGESADPSMYTQLWTDNIGVQRFRKLIATYKGLDADGKETDKEVEIVVNENGTTDYVMDKNWFLKNLLWSDADAMHHLGMMADAMRNVTWFPFKMWSVGLPYLETGDEIEIPTRDGTFTSYILTRKLDGIQNLQDQYLNGNLDVY